jgi:hypothetical protein
MQHISQVMSVTCNQALLFVTLSVDDIMGPFLGTNGPAGPKTWDRGSDRRSEWEADRGRYGIVQAGWIPNPMPSSQTAALLVATINNFFETKQRRPCWWQQLIISLKQNIFPWPKHYDFP